MIKFTEGGLIDIWPEKKSPRMQALSYALQQAMKMVKRYADRSRCYAAIDELPEEILDYLAVEMRSMYYDQSMEIEKKRDIIKNTIKWYTYAGTADTVADMVSVVFGAGQIVEWFNYDEPPYTPGTFDIVTSGRLTEDIMDQLNTMIKKAKNARSQIRRVIIVRDVHSVTHMAIHQTAVQECTVLNIIREDKAAGTAKYEATAAYVTPDTFAINTVNEDAQAAAGQSLVAFGTTTSGSQTTVTNETTGEASVTLAENAAIHGGIYNTTTFIKEES